MRPRNVRFLTPERSALLSGLGFTQKVLKASTTGSQFSFDRIRRLHGFRPLVRRDRNRQHIKGLPIFGQQFAVLPDGVREYKIQKFSFLVGRLILEQLVSAAG